MRRSALILACIGTLAGLSGVVQVDSATIAPQHKPAQLTTLGPRHRSHTSTEATSKRMRCLAFGFTSRRQPSISLI